MDRGGRALPALPRPLAVGLVGLSLTGVLAVLVAVDPGGPGDLAGLGGLVSVNAAAVLTGAVGIGACLFAAVRLQGRMRFAWSMFGLGVVLNSIGDVLWLVDESTVEGMTVVEASDLAYLSALVPPVLGLVGYPILRGGRQTWRVLLLDGLVLMAAVVYLCHTFLLREIYEATHNPWHVLSLGVYPVATALLATVALLLLLRSEGELRLDIVLGAAALEAYAVAGSAYALAGLPGAAGSLQTVGDAAYLVTPLVVAGAALSAGLLPTPKRTLRRHLPGVVSPLLPDLAALAALGLAIVVTGRDPVSVGLGVVTLTAVGLRQMSQTAAGERLRGELQTLVGERTRELAQLTEDYRRLDSMKLEFVTAVSHELRTPLASIRGALEMLHDGDAGDLPPQALSMVGVASRGSERLTRLVDDIIDLERLESGTFGFRPGEHAVGGLIADAVRSLECLAQESTVEVGTDVVESVAWCDPDRVTQVLVNLLGNALKFAPAGSRVTVGARPESGDVLLWVSDQGAGIPADQVEAIFDRFHQVEMDESRQRGGAGLGLTICRHIVLRHGGRIWVDTGAAGSTFWFTLPGPGTSPPQLARPGGPAYTAVA